MKVISTLIPMTKTTLDDAPTLLEAIAIGIARSAPPKGTRYHRVWNKGYYQALQDIRAGVLVFEDGHFHTGPHWLDKFG